MTTPRPRTHLDTAACWALLEQESVGRLALTDGDGAPDIFPVNFAAHEGAVYLHTAADIKDVRLAMRPAAAFEIDGHDAEGWWSVVLRGTASRADDPIEIERSGIMHVATASPRRKPHVMKITAATVTGRRFADRAAPKPSALAPTPSPDGHDDDRRENESRRFTRPVKIPSAPPLRE